MSFITTYPNDFKTDSIHIDSILLYNFNISIDTTISGEGIIPGSKYSMVSVYNPSSNVKFNNIIYSFKGVYITKKNDIIDNNTSYNHVFLIECVNYNLDKYLYISLPVLSSDTDTELNTLFSSATYILKDLNLFIPIDTGFYSYKTTGINDKVTDVILFKTSNLKMKDIALTESPTQSVIDVPLTISKNPPTKVSIISNTYSENDIYIDCQPVDETQQDTVIKMITSYEQIYNFVETIVPFLFIFGLLYIILYYKPGKQL
jgi:hypothetical protein